MGRTLRVRSFVIAKIPSVQNHQIFLKKWPFLYGIKIQLSTVKNLKKP